jgi:DEAD/DEAH box helicase domain-containing protein
LPIPTPPNLEIQLETQAAWLNIPDSLMERYARDFSLRGSASDDHESNPVIHFESAIHSLKHAILKAFPEYVPCDRDEIAGIYRLHTAEMAGRLIFFDNFPGGLGLCNEFLNEPSMILKGALDVLERCTCADDAGCPVCLSYFSCHNFNQGISKLAGRYLLRVLLGESTHAVLKDLEKHIDLNISAAD